MPFDIATARPVQEEKSGFDIGTAKPLGPEIPSIESEQPVAPAAQPAAQEDQKVNLLSPEAAGMKTPLSDVGLELMAAVNRGTVELADFLLPDQINAILQLSGSENRVPTVSEQEVVQEGAAGGFMEPGVPRQVAQFAGEFAAPSPPVGQLVKSARLLDEATELPSQVAKGVRAPDAPARLADAPIKTSAEKSVIRQGVDPRLARLMKTTTPDTKKKLANMLGIVKGAKGDLRVGDRLRVWDIAGDSADQRIKHIRRVNKAAGEAVGKAADSLKGKSVKFTKAADDFKAGLEGHGVKLSKNPDTGATIADFSDSIFKDTPEPQKIAKSLLRDADQAEGMDGRRLHFVKGAIDELVNWETKLTKSAGKVEGVAKSFRGGINEALGQASERYRRANGIFSETIDVLNNAAKATGVKLSPDEKGFSEALGTGLRRVLSNAQSRSTASKAVDDLDAIASKHGANFGDSIRDQISVANQLDTMFDLSAKTGLAGETSKAIRAFDVASGQRTAFGAGTDLIKEGFDRVRGINEENAIKELERLLRE